MPLIELNRNDEGAFVVEWFHPVITEWVYDTTHKSHAKAKQYVLTNKNFDGVLYRIKPVKKVTGKK